MSGMMLAYLRRHAVAVAALFVALGGTSYAATQVVTAKRPHLRTG